MSRKSRRTDIAEQHSQYLSERRRQAAGTIATRYPHVRSVTLELTFVDHDGHAETAKQTDDRGPRHSALFIFDCPYWECVGGGHDLDDEIDQLLKDRVEESSGIHVCPGWQDPERVGKHRCFGELRYVVRAAYADAH